ncbi:response regulator [Rubinisphaera italica]|uniref:Transcriptional regulatory protein DegU n=1 Tax=Rubinisphaera italica TaxID=2527969 RepID=A0A5C5XK68_9PLAN|nr:response regulator [Rubinisphaera italica]TWT62525.1 Transcriptional regulatory protein DegU [Rubinisphaera italica]
MTSILVVDDSLFDLKRAQHLLQKQIPDSQILTASDGVIALSIVEEFHPQVVVTDLQMPNMNGLELVMELQERFPLIPVVLMTAAGSEKIAAEALTKGAASYVPKSQLAVDLAPVVSRLLGLAREKNHQQKLLMSLSEATFIMDNDRNLHSTFVQEFRHSLEMRKMFSENDCFRITTAIDEALSNAYFHGNLEVSSKLREQDLHSFEALAMKRQSEEPYRDRQIRVHIRFDAGLTVTISDEGPGFDPKSLPDPFSDGFAERPCGRGVLLMKSFMDNVQFNKRGNQVILFKNSSSLTGVSS